MGMRRDEIKALLKSHGVRAVVNVVADLLEGRSLPNGRTEKLKPDSFSIRELWEGLVGPCEMTLPSYRETQIIREAVDSTAFVAVTKLLLASKVIEGYNSVDGAIGDSLVTSMPSTRRVENVAGFSDLEGMKEVNEGQAYEDSSIADKYVTTKALKKGRLLSISEEAIMEDQTGQLLVRAGKIGEIARTDREETIINAVVDKDSNVHRPSGTAAALYSTGNGNLMGTAGATSGFTTAAPLLDWTDLEEAQDFHAQSIKTDRQVGGGKPIIWSPKILLVPKGLNGTGLRIQNATEVRITTGTDQVTIFNNPLSGQFQTLSSPFIALSGLTDATGDWYYGDFKKQFFWQDIWPIQVFRQDSTGPEAFARDVVAIFKVRYLGGVFAADFRWVVKTKSA